MQALHQALLGPRLQNLSKGRQRLQSHILIGRVSGEQKEYILLPAFISSSGSEQNNQLSYNNYYMLGGDR